MDSQLNADAGRPAGQHTWSQLSAARFWWIVGWAMVVFVLYSTLSPARYVPGLGLLNDKVEHGSAFFGMTFWFGGLMSRRRYWLLGIGMSLFGAGIEVAQGTMGLGRDMDFWDWVADTNGVIVALVALYAAWYFSGGSWMRLAERLAGQRPPAHG